ncbi:MAG TPA: class I SAM-dependent methyltransferase family protein [Candidatus Thermoplasmatota archaeon]|nr:class I SAM-dependent methyltransferase family protein [Candidatus Thermoplasmatota archaeon]
MSALLAEAARTRLSREANLDARRRIHRRDDGRVDIPVLDPSRAERVARDFGGEVVESASDGARPPREPRDIVIDRLRGRIPDEKLELVPRKWERLGHVVLLRIPEPLRDAETLVAEAFAEALRVKTVLEDAAGVAGEFREMAARVLHGSVTETVAVENGILYKLDAARIMFSSGNTHERTLAARTPAAGETVVDLFAGIGYFTLPIAVYAKPAKLVACEKNPAAFRYLVENVRLNDVEDVVEARLGDNRDVAPRGLADRVLMGYVGGTRAFLPVSLDALKREGGVLHFHDTAPADRWREEVSGAVVEAARAAGRSAEVLRERVVKNYAPGIVHAVAEVRIGPEVAS